MYTIILGYEQWSREAELKKKIIEKFIILVLKQKYSRRSW